MNNLAKSLIAAASTVVLLTGCAGVSLRGATAETAEKNTAEATVEAPSYQTLEEYYRQPLNWGSCPEEMDQAPQDTCTQFWVPKDYADLSLGSLRITALKHDEVKGGAQRYLFMNPGGPGSSAADFVGENASHLIPTRIREQFALIGMDSRGTRFSTPVKCVNDEQREQMLSEDTPNIFTSQGLEKARAEMSDLGQKCLTGGDVVKYMDTVSVARDMEMLRELLQVPQLDYLGFSYGTHLGAQYADLFPQKVGRMVLDGAVDPTVSYEELGVLQAQGFLDSLIHFADHCSEQKEQLCPIPAGRRGAEALIDFAVSLDAKPLQVRDRKLNTQLALTAIFGPLYNENLYDTLIVALGPAMNNADGRALLQIADLYNERYAEGGFKSNKDEAFVAIHHLDYPLVSAEASAAAAQKLKAENPLLAPFFSYGDYIRAAWPVAPRVKKLEPLKAKGAGPILVLGTTHDPATPMSMARGLAQQLESGVLIEVEGWSHTSYSAFASECVAGAVDAYLLRGTPPTNGLRCG